MWWNVARQLVVKASRASSRKTSCVMRLWALAHSLVGEFLASCKKQLSNYSSASLMPLGMKCACTCADGKRDLIPSQWSVSQEHRKCGWCWMSCHVMSCHVMSSQVKSSQVKSSQVKSCHVMSCHVLCCVVSCRDVLCYCLLCGKEEAMLRL